MPMRFFDCHCHTERSDCSEDVSLDMYVNIARESDAVFAITDHSAHIFYPPESPWAFWGEGAEALFEQCHAQGMARCAQYAQDLRAAQTGGMLVGVELDALPDGRVVFDPDLLGELDFIVGAVHGIRALAAEAPSPYSWTSTRRAPCACASWACTPWHTRSGSGARSSATCPPT